MRIFFIIFFIGITNMLKAKNDTTTNIINCISVQISADKPLADLAKRFGYFDKVGVSFFHKSNKNWLLGARMHFMFGSQIKEPGFLNNLGTSVGGTITNSGGVDILRIYQRGYNIGLDVGKIFPFWQANKNSGPFWMNSLGFMQHKINIFDRDNQYPQLISDYKKGYDRLSNGMYVDEMFGYMYFAKSRSVAAFLALNINIAPTQGRRDFWLDVQTSGRDKRLDASIGVMFGWVIPIYKKKVEDTYY